jgi:hypothetical protein
MQRCSLVRTLGLLVVLASAAGCALSTEIRTPIGYSPVIATDGAAVAGAAVVVVAEALLPPEAPPAPMCTDGEPNPPHTCPSTVPVLPPREVLEPQLTAKALR